MRSLAAVGVCFCWLGLATECGGQQFWQPTAALADGQTVRNARILGLDGDLLSPVLATDALRGADYHEWCLRWNKLAEYRATQATIPPRTIRGGESEYRSFTTGTLGGSLFRRTRGSVRTLSSSRWNERQWRIGGYSGGPVAIYNPFVTAGRYDLPQSLASQP